MMASVQIKMTIEANASPNFAHIKKNCLRNAVIIFLCFCFTVSYAQQKTSPGIIIGNVLDTDNSKAIPGATVALINIADTGFKRYALTGKDGAFLFDRFPLGY